MRILLRAKPGAIQRLRALKGMSADALSKAAGLTTMGIYYVENNRKNTRPATAKAIADALGVEMKELFEMQEGD